MSRAIAPEDIDALLARDHASPHDLLGAHPCNGGVVVRAYRPAATEVWALPDDGQPVELAMRHPGGLFEGVIEGARMVPSYRIEVRYPDGNRFTFRDPYAFVPTLGDASLRVLDARSGAVVRTIRVGEAPTAVAVDPGTGRVVVANGGAASVSGSSHG